MSSTPIPGRGAEGLGSSTAVSIDVSIETTGIPMPASRLNLRSAAVFSDVVSEVSVEFVDDDEDEDEDDDVDSVTLVD